MPGDPPPLPPRPRALLFAVFLLSSAASLVYEIAWVRRLCLVFGSTTLAISTVLAAFMAGLALGSFAIGRYADRHASKAVRLYGALELGIALFGAVMPWLLQAVEAAYLPLAPALEDSPPTFFAVQFLLAGAVLAVPTAMMGGTLPLLARAVVEADEEVPRQVGALYAANTVGAGLGAAAAAYSLLPFYGLRQTELTAVAASVAAGLTALAIGRRLAAAGPVVETDAPKSPLPLSPEAKTLLVGIALSGFAAMACAVAWSRVLALVLGSSVYSFGMTVLVFLIGLSAGSALFALLSRGKRRAASIFAASQVAATVALTAAILVVPRLPALFLRGFPAAQASFGMLQAWDFVLAALLLLPSAVLFGIAFPAAIAATSGSLETLGRGVGRVTAANTLGTVAGAFCAGFLLIPRVGLKTTLAAAAAAAAAAGIAALRLEAASRRRRVLTGVAAAGFAAVLLLPQWPRQILTMGASVYARSWANPDVFLAVASTRQVLFYKDGVSTTLSVVRQNAKSYYASNGKTDASTDPGDMANQIFLGQIPMLLHPDPQEVFILGLGTGVSAAAVARYPVHSIEIVDIEPAGREAARLFEAENRSVLADPRVRLIAADGRNRLLAQPKRYDVIVSDSSDVWVAGVGNLFTQEFYALAKKRLKPRGLMVQWFHMHSLPPDQLKLIVATFQFVFPYTSLWRPNHGDIILVGSADRVVWDWPRLAERFQNVPGVSQDLLSIGIWHPLAVFAAYVCDGQELAAMLRGVPRTHTDDRPVIEYLSPRAAYQDTTTANERMIAEAQG
ncbi:MAG: fused MFS/spermidine synthase, partial [Thermoanaerobaculia bacterium]